jgi:integrase
MAKGKITKKLVDNLLCDAKAEGRTLYCWDTDLTGFGVLATKGGSASYFVEYRLGGRGTPNKRLTIGKHGALTPDEARKRAKVDLGKVASGEDVAQTKQKERRRLAAGTFKDATETYLSKRGRDNASWSETRRLIEYDAIPELGARPMVTITQSDVAALIDKVSTRSPSVGRALFAALRPFFRWATQQSLTDTNPISQLDAPRGSPSRKRTLNRDELRAFWKTTAVLGWPFCPIYRLLLLTAQRREEVGGMMWEELSLEHGIWRLPPKEEFQPQRTKNGEEHIVDLSPQALAILQALPGERRGLVFTTNKATAPSGFSKVKKEIDSLMAKHLDSSLKPWRTHDLRRTGATLMGEELEVDPGVIERILNHLTGSQSGVQGIYQRQKYRKKRREALIAWGAWVEELIGAQFNDGLVTKKVLRRPKKEKAECLS